MRALSKCVQCVQCVRAAGSSEQILQRLSQTFIPLLSQQLGWGNTDLFCFLSTPPPNFPNSETDLPGEPSCVESEFCGKIFCGVCGPLLGAVGWALMLKALLGR